MLAQTPSGREAVRSEETVFSRDPGLLVLVHMNVVWPHQTGPQATGPWTTGPPTVGNLVQTATFPSVSSQLCPQTSHTGSLRAPRMRTGCIVWDTLPDPMDPACPHGSCLPGPCLPGPLPGAPAGTLPVPGDSEVRVSQGARVQNQAWWVGWAAVKEPLPGGWV